MARLLGRSPQQIAANLRKLVKLFPDGYLPEERQRLRIFDGGAGRANGRRVAEAAWPWRVDGVSIDSPDVDEPPNGASRPEAEIHSIERRAARLLRTANGQREWNQLAGDLRKWFRRHLTDDGLLATEPWQTFAALPAVVRLRIALNELQWSEPMQRGYERMVEAAFRTSRSDGWPFVDTPPPSREWVKLMAHVGAEPGRRAWRSVPRLLWNAPGRATRTAPPTPGFESDGACVAVMRQDWSRRGAFLAVDFRNGPCLVHLCVMSREILKGAWDATLLAGSKRLPVEGDWESTCWFADADGEYLELRVKLGAGLVVERQAYLSRVTRSLWLADTVKSDKRRNLELSWSTPAPAIAGLEGTPPTRAQTARGPDFPLRLLPIGLPANPMAAADGRLSLRDGRIEISTQSHSDRLFLPLVLCWDAKRLEPQQEWRRLTVTNDRRLAPPDEVAAFRVPLHGHQTVYFRALNKAMRYAFVGHQTYHECVIGHIDSSGDLKEWLMVE